MIVSGGENVFPKEVEDCLARHDAVVEVAAIGVDDDDFGKRLRAFVVLKDGSSASEDDLKAHVKDNLARYKVPREIVVLDELPRNATGKVLKRELAEHDDRTPTRLRRWLRLRRVGRGVTGLALGAPAPDFTLRDQFGQDVTLSSFRGTKAVALVFYPFAFSGVCTGEMAGIRDRLAEFMTFDTEVLGISCDPVFAQRALADADGLNFPLLSDFWPHGEVTRAYDVFNERQRRAPPLVVRHRPGGAGPLVGPQPQRRGPRPRGAPAPAARARVTRPGVGMVRPGHATPHLDQSRIDPSGALARLRPGQYVSTSLSRW